MSRHPNDKNPHDAACESALNKIDAQAGQGVDAFYAMAFRDGWQAHGAAGASEGQAVRYVIDEQSALGQSLKHIERQDAEIAALRESLTLATDTANLLRERIAGMEKDAERWRAWLPIRDHYRWDVCSEKEATQIVDDTIAEQKETKQ